MAIDDRDTAPILVWLRQDLRLTDNLALIAAARTGRPVIPLYILDETPGVRPMGAASLWWLDKSLAALASALTAIGSRLVLRRGVAETILADLVAETGASGVLWNRLYDPAAIARDTAIKMRLKDDGVACDSFNAGLLNEPWTVKTGAGQPYKVFTPYWRAARDQLGAVSVEPAPTALAAPGAWPRGDALGDWRLHPAAPDWSTSFGLWTPGEAGALERLDDFLSGPFDGYSRGRDLPGVEATSRLSPHLHFGEIGPRQVWLAARNAAEAGDAPAGEVEKFLSEIGWREFNHSILFHNPDLPKSNFRPEFDGFPWARDAAAFETWSRGRTGYPIVDADLASNVGNWQWVAGSGADAAPYFRIFNPIAQGERFDPAGAYVRRWIPELANLPDALIHEPWRAPAQLSAEAARIYSEPVVWHAAARERALQAYRGLKGD